MRRKSEKNGCCPIKACEKWVFSTASAPSLLGANLRKTGFKVAPQIYIVPIRQRPLWLTNGTSPPKLDSGSQKWSWSASWFYPLAQSHKGHWILSCPWLAGPEHTPLQPKYREETSKYAPEVRKPPKHDSYILHLRKASLCFLHRNSSRFTLSPKPQPFLQSLIQESQLPIKNPNWPLPPKLFITASDRYTFQPHPPS